MRVCFSIILLLAANAALAQPARPGRLNPPHLNEMPLAERVMREITAANPQDTAARRMGAFEQLSDILQELSQGRTALGTGTPDENRIMQEYAEGRSRAMMEVYRGPQDDNLVPALRRFDNDPALREEILNKFFSPALRAQSMAIHRELEARIAAMRKQNTAFGGQATPRPAPAAVASAAPVPARATTPVAKPPLPPDPSIAKARAAGVDTKVFGIQLGDRITLPPCGMLGLLQASTTCIVDGEIGDIVSALAGIVDPSLADIVAIRLSQENCPRWISDCRVIATVEKERLIGVTIQPDGASVERATASELRLKYGNRLTDRQRFVTPLNGGAQFEVHDLEWEFPGLHVQYRPVHDTIFKGVIFIETDRAKQIRSERDQRVNRPKL